MAFTPGRVDASAEQTDVAAFAVLEPFADGFRNYLRAESSIPAEDFLVDKAQLLRLSAPELVVLLGGMRMLDANYQGSRHGVFTHRPGVLSTDYFRNLLDMKYVWKAKEGEQLFAVCDRASGAEKWTATRVDLVCGSNSQLRAIAEVYGQDDAHQKFVEDFAHAWAKVMHADRFDLVV